MSSDADLEAIADAAIDIRTGLDPEMVDPIVMQYEIGLLPTGTLITSLGSCLRIMYHNNDLHCHCGILIWCYYDGSDRISLNYEPNRTRPLVLELIGPAPHSVNPVSHVFLNEVGSIVYEKEHAYRPQQYLLDHPRYLNIVAKLMRILPLTYHGNHPMTAYMHKWQPLIVNKPLKTGYNDVRDYYNELLSKEDPFISGLRGERTVSSACVDMVITFISLLHEELFINLQPQEIAEGQVPASKRLWTDSSDYDVGKLLNSTSEIYSLYEREPQPVCKGIHTQWKSKGTVVAFFLPICFGLFIILAIGVWVKPVSHLVFASRLN